MSAEPRPVECHRGTDDNGRPYCAAHGSSWPCRDEAREQIAHFLYRDGNPFPDRWREISEFDRDEWRADADQLMALPAVQALLDPTVDLDRIAGRIVPPNEMRLREGL